MPPARSGPGFVLRLVLRRHGRAGAAASPTSADLLLADLGASLGLSALIVLPIATLIALLDRPEIPPDPELWLPTPSWIHRPLVLALSAWFAAALSLVAVLRLARANAADDADERAAEPERPSP